MAGKGLQRRALPGPPGGGSTVSTAASDPQGNRSQHFLNKVTELDHFQTVAFVVCFPLKAERVREFLRNDNGAQVLGVNYLRAYRGDPRPSNESEMTTRKRNTHCALFSHHQHVTFGGDKATGWDPFSENWLKSGNRCGPIVFPDVRP